MNKLLKITGINRVFYYDINTEMTLMNRRMMYEKPKQ